MIFRPYLACLTKADAYCLWFKLPDWDLLYPPPPSKYSSTNLEVLRLFVILSPRIALRFCAWKPAFLFLFLFFCLHSLPCRLCLIGITTTVTPAGTVFPAVFNIHQLSLKSRTSSLSDPSLNLDYPLINPSDYSCQKCSELSIRLYCHSQDPCSCRMLDGTYGKDLRLAGHAVLPALPNSYERSW